MMGNLFGIPICSLYTQRRFALFMGLNDSRRYEEIGIVCDVLGSVLKSSDIVGPTSAEATHNEWRISVIEVLLFSAWKQILQGVSKSRLACDKSLQTGSITK